MNHYDPTEEKVATEPDDTVHVIMTGLAAAMTLRFDRMGEIEIEAMVAPKGMRPMRMHVRLSAD